MAKEIKNVKVTEAEANDEIKEVKEETAVAVTQTDASNSEETPEKEKFTTKVWRKVKKPLAIAGGVAAGAAALFAAVKIGEAKGFDKACDAFDNVNEPDPDDESDLEDISDEVEAIEVTEF